LRKAKRVKPANEVSARNSATSRRSFMAGSVAGVFSAWIADWHGVAAAAAYAQQAAQHSALPGRPVKFGVLTVEQAAELDAIVSQIIPTDETPGAHEAGVVYFIDRSLATFASPSRPIYTQGFGELQAKAQAMFPSSGKFSALSSAQQIQLLSAIETTPFFKTVRDHTVIGMFASPQHGGNYQKAGWTLIGFEDTLSFKPPFGYYDAAQ